MSSVLRLLFFAALSLALWIVPASSQYDNLHISCNGAARYDASTNGSTRLITSTSSRPIYVCGYSIWAGGTAAVKFISGTGTNCATGSADMTPAFALTTQTGVSDSSPFYRGLSAGAGRDICINTSAGVAVQAIIFYRR